MTVANRLGRVLASVGTLAGLVYAVGAGKKW
jgi:hypothetical protein